MRKLFGPLSEEHLGSIGRERRAQRSAHAVPLPQLCLESDAERAALRRLKLSSWSKRLVLAYLYYIAQAVESRQPNGQERYKPSQLIRELRRRAKQVRGFVTRLEKRLPVPLPLLALPLPPVRELRLYAEKLEEHARAFAGPPEPPRYRPLSDMLRTLSVEEFAEMTRPHSLRHPPQKRKARPETELLRELIGLVQVKSGSPHWNDLAVLLRRPCNDKAVNKDRLRSLAKDARRKTTRARAHFPLTRSHFPKPRTPFTPV